MRFMSAGCTSVFLRNARLRFDVFFVRMWFVNA
jgi:hypothetical protein